MTRNEALIKGKNEIGQKQHVNTIIGDDFWPVVKQHEKLQKETLKSKVLCLLTARTGVGRPMAEH